MTDTISHLKSKNLYHEALKDTKTLHCQGILPVTANHPNADSLITTELLIQAQKKDEQCRTLAAEFHKPDTPKTSISCTWIRTVHYVNQ